MDIIITNNPMVRDKAKSIKIVYVNGGFMDVLTLVRDHIHKGHRLITHPLSGSIKPNETPYKSVVISDKAMGLEVQSLTIIENAITKTRDLLQIRKPQWEGPVLEDFQLIDYDLVKPLLGA